MADAMAILHCLARIDGQDIEFVISSAPTDMCHGGGPPSSAEIADLRPGTSTFEMIDAKDFTRRSLCLWVIDFDACNTISIDQAGVKAAVKAFGKTLPYCPWPSQDTGSVDHALWKDFGNRYISTSNKLGGAPQFATGFLDGVEAAVKATRQTTSTAPPTAPPSRARLTVQSHDDVAKRAYSLPEVVFLTVAHTVWLRGRAAEIDQYGVDAELQRRDAFLDVPR